MTDDNNHLPQSDHEFQGPLTHDVMPVSQSNLDDIELSVREQLDLDVPTDAIRSSISEQLMALGLEPLTDDETSRTFTLEGEGEPEEHTIVVDPSDFGTRVRSIAEMGITDLADAESSHEHETPKERMNRLLGELAASSAVVESDESSATYDIDDIDRSSAENDSAEEDSVSEDAEGVSKNDEKIGEVLSATEWKSVNDKKNMLAGQVGGLLSRFAELQDMLITMKRTGYSQALGQDIAEKFTSFRSKLNQDEMDDDELSRATRQLHDMTIDLRDQVTIDEDVSDRDRYDTASIESVAAEFMDAGRVVQGSLDDIRAAIVPHSGVESWVEDLSRTPQGFETNIALLRQWIEATGADLQDIRGRLASLQVQTEDIRRLNQARM